MLGTGATIGGVCYASVIMKHLYSAFTDRLKCQGKYYLGTCHPQFILRAVYLETGTECKCLSLL